MSSNFQSFQLPAIQDCQDYVRLVPANSVVEIPVVGEFVYCKFSDGETKVRIAGKTTAMESGDERRSGTVFNGVQLENDTDVDKAVVFVIGFGGFDRKIVQGNISIEPVLRRADGTLKPDTRQTLQIDLTPSNLALTDYNKNDVIAQGANPIMADGSVIKDDARCFRGRNGLFTVFDFINDGGGNFRHYFFEFNSDMEIVGTIIYDFYTLDGVGGEDWTYKPGTGYLRIDNNDLYNVVSSGQGRIFTTPFNCDGVEWIPERSVYAFGNTDDTSVHIYSENFEYIETIDTDNNAPQTVNYDPNLDALIIGRQGASAGLYKFDGSAATLIGLPNIAGTLTTENGIVVTGPNTYAINAARSNFNNAPIIVKAAKEAFTTKPEFIARSPECELEGAFVRPQVIPQITADITFEELQKGVTLNGELIKAAIEYYFKRAVSDDYLDHVYLLDLTRNSAGLPFKAVSSGNRTFMADGVTDDFGTLTPAKMTIIVDNELQLGEPL